MTVLVVAEKPSVARDIAAVLGARSRQDGYLEGGAWIVTWAIGHLVALAEPEAMNAAWKRWRLADLPMLPNAWPLVVVPGTRDQFAVVRRLLLSKEVRGVVCATDAGREGELIFRTIYEAAGATKPVKRLWISSLTPAAIAAGFRSLRDARDLDGLADAARGRSRADWLVGMNLSRLYSVRHDAHLSVGRVQTPTLAMLVAREIEIRDFLPEDYLEVVATFLPRLDAGNGEQATYEGTYVRPDVRGPDARRLPADGALANAVLARSLTGTAAVASVDREQRRLPPPLLYDLTELQRHANRLYGFTAQRTLELAQKLYEERKLLSYPRTDSRHLSQTVASTLPTIAAAVAEPYRALLAEGTGTRPLGPRFVDDARVSDHHAIIPTGARMPPELPADERKIYDLVCRRLLSAWHGDHVVAVTTVVTEITSGETRDRDRYSSNGTEVVAPGWKVLDIVTRKAAFADEPAIPTGLARGTACTVTSARALPKKTRPPPRFTDGTLLTAMETAGRLVEDDEVSRAMRDRGLGTPATRAAILETLLRREYVVRDGKMLSATDKGIALVRVVHPHVKSPAMTGEWEAKLARIERGAESLATFMREIEQWVREVVGSAAPALPPAAPTDPPSAARISSAAPSTATASRPLRAARSRDLDELLGSAFGFASFRPYQRAVCEAAAAGSDVLLVMPTGAGKSLCYQLPGLARGGTTLVVSPLIALMEDQVAQLVRRGLAADRIHSGRTRLESRAVCKAYLEGELDFLFIAPERLKVTGFPEMLARRKPSLVAIDEAHCISQWGHDFRPDYRMLGQRLPLLRPAPILALTATATPLVQDDIVEELRLASARRFIHGFRRTNIAIELVETSPKDRPAIVRKLLDEPARRPAIVYAPTRASSEEIAESLAGRLRAAAYHAGLSAAVRDSVQAAFLGGELDVIVATIAFGMGIDKPDVRTVFHTALPATIEGYYQEIGRAGRDGAPSRAILLHAWADTKTHEFFLARDYPEPEVVAKVHGAIPASGGTIASLARRARVGDAFEKALEKLWVHGGAIVRPDETVTRIAADWRSAYERQRAHKVEQLELIRRFAVTPACRMLELVAHFGDQNDSHAPCGICDVCAPLLAVVLRFRTASSHELASAQRILEALRSRDGRSAGQLHRDLFEGSAVDRDACESLLDALARASLVTLASDAFVRDGERIVFQRVMLTPRGRTDDALARGVLRMAVPPESEPTRRTGGGKKARSKKKTRASRPTRTPRPTSPQAHGLEAELRAWRTKEAKRRRSPPFRVLTDEAIRGIAACRPTSEAALLGVKGMGPRLVERYGAALLSLIITNHPSRSSTP